MSRWVAPLGPTVAHTLHASGGALARVQAALRRAHDTQADLNAFVCIDDDGATLAARASDARTDAPRALEGIPVCVKDAFVTAPPLGTTAGSRMLRDWIAPPGFEATAVQRLRERGGAVVVGKTNLDEFSMGSSTSRSVHGPTYNPHGTGLTPGGSSGGTAAAVAAGCAVAGLGTDTGGSVRQPAAMCGVVGFKPSYGAVSRWGVVPMASSLDVVSIVARHVEDVRCVFDVIRGPDGLDSTAAPPLHAGLEASSGLERPLRVGVSTDHYPVEMDRAVVERWHQLAARLGWDAKTVLPMPHTRAALPCYYVIASAEASSNLARYDGVRFGLRADSAAARASVAALFQETRGLGFGPSVVRRILMGSFVMSRELDNIFVQAQRVRRLVLRDFERAFEHCDVMVLPTVASTTIPSVAGVLGAASPIDEWVGDLLTVAPSLAGLPAVSVPVGAPPLALQVVGPRFADLHVLHVAQRLQELVRNE